MNNSNTPSLFSVRRALKKSFYFSAAPALFISLPVHAVEFVNADKTIRGNTGTAYSVNPGVTLTALNATTYSIIGNGNARLVIDGSVITKPAEGDGTTMTSAFTGAGILSNSQVNNLHSGSTWAVRTTAGGLLQVANSSISSVAQGLQVGTGSTLDMSGTAVSAQALGMQVVSGTANVAGSSITGSKGIVLANANPSNPVASNLALAGSQVTGTSGAAIEVGLGVGPQFGAQANIRLSNGTALVGSDGVAIRVTEASAATVEVDNSAIVGDYVVENSARGELALRNGASWTGRLENLDALAVSSNAQWNMVESTSLNSLTLEGGTVKLGTGGDFYRLQLGELSGSGQFALHTDFSTDTTDVVQVTGASSGDHTLEVAATGQDAATGNDIRVVETADGAARFSLSGGNVDVGTYQYRLVQQGNDWYLAPTQVITPGTASVLALFNATPSVWYGEMTTLRSRMGELRLNEGSTGGWVRTYGNKFNVATGSGLGYSQYQHGISFGADAPAPWGDGQWLVGVLAGYSESDLDLSRGTTGEVKSYYAGAYTTWLDKASGYYFDATVKANRFRNKAEVTLSDNTRTHGDYQAAGLGASAEFGRHVALDNGYFIEPYTQWTALVVQGKDVELDNGMSAHGDRTRSLVGKVGVTGGRTFDLGNGQKVQPYLRVAAAQEFARNNPVSVNANRFDNDLAGTRGELGVGVAVSVADRLQLHADFDYSHGDAIEQPWGVNVGLRYNW